MNGKKWFLRNERRRIKDSPNYREGSFQNPEKTEVLGLESAFKMLREFSKKPDSVTPSGRLKTLVPDFGSHPAEKDIAITWFGHSSYIIQLNDQNILVDPVFSGYASPFKFMIRSFKGSEVMNEDMLPEIHVLVITHDHYDHLDAACLRKIVRKVNKVVCSLGVGRILTGLGFSTEIINDLDWWEKTEIGRLCYTAVPGRHFSGRGIKRMQTLWSGFVLEHERGKIFIGGDSGYGQHFKEIGKRFGSFDLVMLEAGQYNKMWHHIHMLPEETVQAALDLKARTLLPVHWGKFALALHPWTEPVEKVLEAAEGQPLEVCTPKIGEKIVLGKNMPKERWWRE